MSSSTVPHAPPVTLSAPHLDPLGWPLRHTTHSLPLFRLPFHPYGFSFSETIMFLHQIFYQGLKARISSWPTLVLGECLSPPGRVSFLLAEPSPPSSSHCNSTGVSLTGGGGEMHCAARSLLLHVSRETGAQNPREPRFPRSWFCRAVEGGGWAVHGRADAAEHRGV